jgi:hypothetical protein
MILNSHIIRTIISGLEHNVSQDSFVSSCDGLISQWFPDPVGRTGATGYIGGTLLDTLYARRPELDIRVLLRSVPIGFEEKYPKVHIVHGSYDDFDIVAAAASQANIVLRELTVLRQVPNASRN